MKACSIHDHTILGDRPLRGTTPQYITDENGAVVASGIHPVHARLFAAAPELADLARRYLRLMESDDDQEPLINDIRDVRAVLARIEG